ncbi:MAG: Gfo/Idh/MocA family protein, partial [Candidatus Methylacidiphilales bacterium]
MHGHNSLFCSRGWRAEFYLRIARDLPELFPLAGVVARRPEVRDRLAREWNAPVFSTVEELLERTSPGFIVSSVPWAANLPLIESLNDSSRTDGGVPVLSETPIAPELDNLRKVAALVRAGARIQVAEQYIFQPLHAARLALIASGKLGPVREANVSAAHGYHGISLLRHYLQAGMALPKIRARRVTSRIVAG